MWAFVLKGGCLRNPLVLSARSNFVRKMMMLLLLMIMTMIMATAVMLVMMMMMIMMIMMMISCCLQKLMLAHWCGWQKRCWRLFKIIRVDTITMCSPCIDTSCLGRKRNSGNEANVFVEQQWRQMALGVGRCLLLAIWLMCWIWLSPAITVAQLNMTIYYPVLHCTIAKNSLTNEVYCWAFPSDVLISTKKVSKSPSSSIWSSNNSPQNNV